MLNYSHLADEWLGNSDRDEAVRGSKFSRVAPSPAIPIQALRTVRPLV